MRQPLVDTSLVLYVMAVQPCLLSGLDRAIALAWSKAQYVMLAGTLPRLFFDYKYDSYMNTPQAQDNLQKVIDFLTALHSADD